MITLFVVERSGIGGSASYAKSFLLNLDKNRFRPVLIMHHPVQTATTREIKDAGIEIEYLYHNYAYQPERLGDSLPDNPKRNNLFLGAITRGAGYCIYLAGFLFSVIPEMIRFLRVIYNKKPDAVFFNADVIFFVPEIIGCRIAGIPCVVRKNGIGLRDEGKIYRFCSRLVDVFIAGSKAEYEKHVSSKIPYRRIEVVYEGVDVDRFAPAEINMKIRSEFRIGTERPIVGIVSRLDLGKGIPEAINAAAIAREQVPEVVFFVVGEDVTFENKSFRRCLEAKIRSLGLDQNFILAGWRDDVVDILQSIDVFVHCPNEWSEGVAIATLEALSCGKPVVIARNHGLAETAIDGFNGYVVPKGDIDAIARCLLKLLNDPQLRKAMGENSRKMAEAEFDIVKNIRKIERVLIEISERKNG
jgi:glycosyltransferase involved in cell wall biosynthesis